MLDFYHQLLRMLVRQLVNMGLPDDVKELLGAVQVDLGARIKLPLQSEGVTISNTLGQLDNIVVVPNPVVLAITQDTFTSGVVAHKYTAQVH